MTRPGDTGESDVIDLVHALGFLYLRHGQPYRAVVLLILAAQAAPARADVLRTLAAALIEAGMGGQAREVLARHAALQPALEHHPMLRLLRARALLLVGEPDAARAVFQSLEAA